MSMSFSLRPALLCAALATVAATTQSFLENNEGFK